ncbi:MAG: TlpA family protein disulfide reductase [Phycisphaerales bacterium]
MITASLLLAAAFALPADETVTLTLVPKGASSKIGHYAPQRAQFATERPASVSKQPEDLGGPQYGTLPINGGIAFIIDEPDGKPARLFVDTNRNGDLTDDAPAEWTSKENTRGGKTTVMHSGAAMIDIGGKGKPALVSISLYRFDKNDESRAQLKSTILYYRDYMLEGKVALNGKTYDAMLSDEMCRGSFKVEAPKDDEQGSGVSIMLDVNSNGKIDSRGETFDVAKPFNIGGTTYELAEMAADGSAFKVVKSTKVVEEIPTPPDHSVGKTILAFETKDTEGKALKFPADFSGKIVLLDFWATWCGPCMSEMPNVVTAYDKHHAEGFEILGISLDNEGSLKRMPDVMTKAKMTWRQVADGKGWKAEVAQKYAIDSIPATFLVDGTTGKIIGMNLRGEALEAAVAKALAERKK